MTSLLLLTLKVHLEEILRITPRAQTLDSHADFIAQLHRILSKFVLRREKTCVQNDLPKKTEHIIQLPFKAVQRFFV